MILEMHDEVLKLATAIEEQGFWESDKELFQLLREFVTVVRVLVYSSEHGLVVNAGLRERLKMVEQKIVELGGIKPPCRFPCPMPPAYTTRPPAGPVAERTEIMHEAT